MTEFRFLHAADLHIDSPLRGLAADRDAPAERIRAATRAAFTNLVNLALAERVAFVVVAGDLIDGEWQDWRTGHFLLTEIARLKEAGIRFYAIHGNHDAANPVLGRLRLPDGAGMVLDAAQPRTVRLPEHGVSIHGQSFPTRDVRANLARDYPKPEPGDFNIGVLHTAANGRDGHENYAPCTVDQLAKHGYHYWALGHIHAREELARDPCWIVFPGNTQGRHIRETGPKGASLVTVRDGQVASVAHRPLDDVRWAMLDIALTPEQDEGAVLDAVRQGLGLALDEAEGRLLAVRVTLRGPCAAHTALIRDPGKTRDTLHGEAVALAGDGIWLEDARLLTRPPADAAPAGARSGAMGTLLGQIDAVRADALAPGLREYCAKLLNHARGLRDTLGEDHPAVAGARGEMTPELLERARQLLLARIAAED
ncbi:MAG TPA: DNA repair exonuclease [Acetobacteraceae bacterium]|nr:DNA repair exonuclease [Acetobacteraceae bacterium]